MSNHVRRSTPHARMLLWACAATALAQAGCGSPEPGGAARHRSAVTSDSPPAAAGHAPIDPPPQDPGPPMVPGPVRSPPKLDGSEKSVAAFIAWAVASTGAERELGRAVIVDGARDPRNIDFLYQQVLASRRADVSRALVVLAILGEMRVPEAEARLTKLVDLPPESSNALVDGEDPAATALSLVRAKAVDGLAYQGSGSADQKVLTLAAKDPDRNVRSEAMVAYRWNHGDGEEARKKLLSLVRPDETRYVDRLVKAPADGLDGFDARLAQYLQLHPEVIPPAPEPIK